MQLIVIMAFANLQQKHIFLHCLIVQKQAHYHFHQVLVQQLMIDIQLILFLQLKKFFIFNLNKKN